MTELDKPVSKWISEYCDPRNSIEKHRFCEGVAFMARPEHMKHTKEVKGLIKTFKDIDQTLCEMIIDDCGYNPNTESRENLILSVKGMSKDCEFVLNKVRQALKPFEKESECTKSK